MKLTMFFKEVEFCTHEMALLESSTTIFIASRAFVKSTSAEEKCIFMLTKSTLIGDEIAWDFIQMVIHNKCSFTAFCNEMTRRYQTNNMMAGPFMSPKTFIRSFFGWMSAHRIDFQKEVDPWCMYSPKILACDGTHIGVSMCHMNIKPIEKQGPTRCDLFCKTST